MNIYDVKKIKVIQAHYKHLEKIPSKNFLRKKITYHSSKTLFHVDVCGRMSL